MEFEKIIQVVISVYILNVIWPFTLIIGHKCSNFVWHAQRGERKPICALCILLRTPDYWQSLKRLLHSQDGWCGPGRPQVPVYCGTKQGKKKNPREKTTPKWEQKKAKIIFRSPNLLLNTQQAEQSLKVECFIAHTCQKQRHSCYIYAYTKEHRIIE